MKNNDLEYMTSSIRNKELQSLLSEIEEKYNKAYDKNLFGEHTGYYLAGLDAAISVLKCHIVAEQAVLSANIQSETNEPSGKCKAIDLAKYILNRCAEGEHPITNLQLQKMIYCIYKEFAQDDTPLFSDNFEAWKIGPVVPEVYFTYSGYGASYIPWSKIRNVELNLTTIEKFLLDTCISRYSNFGPGDFIEFLRKKGGAWDQIFDEGRGKDKVIPKGLIKEEAKTDKDEDELQENTMRRI